MDYQKEFAVVVSSCDCFKDCWKPFAFSIRKFWPDCPFKIYIISNFLEEDLGPQFTFLCVGEDRLWASNLKKAIAKIKAKYLLYLQEDYFLSKKIDTLGFMCHLKYCLHNNVDYLRLTFPFLESENVVDSIYYKSSLTKKYSLCLQAAIWKKETLNLLLIEGYTGWDFEYNIQKYALNKKIKIKSLGLLQKNKLLGICYVAGTAVRKGRWTRSGYDFLVDNGFKQLCNDREVEGPVLSFFMNLGGYMRPLGAFVVRFLLKPNLNI